MGLRTYVASVTDAQADLELHWPRMSEDPFLHDEAHFMFGVTPRHSVLLLSLHFTYRKQTLKEVYATEAVEHTRNINNTLHYQ